MIDERQNRHGQNLKSKHKDKRNLSIRFETQSLGYICEGMLQLIYIIAHVTLEGNSKNNF